VAGQLLGTVDLLCVLDGTVFMEVDALFGFGTVRLSGGGRATVLIVIRWTFLVESETGIGRFTVRVSGRCEASVILFELSS